MIAQNGKLCGLHHAFSRARDLLDKHSRRAKRLQDGASYDVANEGIKFSAIAVHLERRLAQAGPDRTAVETVLDQFIDMDSITGFFGVRGRSEAGKEAYSLASDNADNTVIQAYSATDQDVDVAIWNMEWLNLHAADRAMLRRAAMVFADMTQDVWVVDGHNRQTAKGLRDALQEEFGQNYDCTFADEDTHPAQILPALKSFGGCGRVAIYRSRLWTGQFFPVSLPGLPSER